MKQKWDKSKKIWYGILGQFMATAECLQKSKTLLDRKEVLQNKCDVYFEDKLSGKNMERPQFKEMLSLLKNGDTVVVVSIDRLGRNLKRIS